MKAFRYISYVFAAASLVACSDLDDQLPEGNEITQDQLTNTTGAVPSRLNATFNSMFSMMGEPGYTFKSTRADDFGFIAAALSQDVEGSDAWFPNNDYNWFSVCGEYSSRNPDYANPWNRYCAPYNQIAIANQLISGGAEGEMLAQAHAVRAFDYMQLAQQYQFSVSNEYNRDLHCVPLVTESTTDYSNNPRATVQEVYDLIISDLNTAVDALQKLDYEPTSKANIGLMAAQGLRARAYLTMGEWDKAAADAYAVIQRADTFMVSGTRFVEPAQMEELLTPGFCDINSKNWLWGVNVTATQAQIEPYATAASWISSLSANGYTAGTSCYLHINKLLYDKISDTDVRKQWWLSPKLKSKMLQNISWTYTDEDGVQQTATSDDIPGLQISDVKEPMDAYTNLKFGCLAGTGSTSNEGAFPMMRIEEMYLIYAEAIEKSSSADVHADGVEWLKDNFITKYRDSNYTTKTCSKNTDEIWLQRRIELWGEGFAISDIMRLEKPIVRVHDYPNDYYPTEFSFNIKSYDPWLLLRFLTQEVNMNAGVKGDNNTGGSLPTAGQNLELKDGVTD